MSASSPAEKLVRMANQIAAFFRSYPEDEAVAGIHKHIVAFWTPKMRTTLETYLREDEGRADALVVRAMTEEPPEAASPIRAATRDPQLLGAGASDAG